MVEVRCPRCQQYWYTDEDEGRVRLCTRCADQLRQNQFRSPVQVDAFFITALVLLPLHVLFILLAVVFPTALGRVLLWYGAIAAVVALAWFRIVWWLDGSGGSSRSETRWFLLFGLLGLACVLAYFSLISLGGGT